MPSKVCIQFPNKKGFHQSVIVENKLAFCVKCRLHGHDITACHKAKVAKGVASDVMQISGKSMGPLCAKKNDENVKDHVAGSEKENPSKLSEENQLPNKTNKPDSEGEWHTVTNRRNRIKENSQLNLSPAKTNGEETRHLKQKW
ncbi:hypothetical protein QQ045_015822 [Rhodiola kirilowii]